MSGTIQSRQEPCWILVIKHKSGGEPERIVKEMGPNPRWRAEKVDDGVNINLNHADYFTMICTQEEREKWKKEHGTP